MTDTAQFTPDLIDTVLNRLAFQEQHNEDLQNDGPFLNLLNPDGEDAGFVRVWKNDSGQHAADRMIWVQLNAGPVNTQLFFIFAKDESAVPHFHAQLVTFPPDGCVYNADLLPRLDVIEHPAYQTAVFKGLNKPYYKATGNTDNTCSRAHQNPAIAAFLSPWGIVSHRTDIAEFERVRPQVESYLDHYLTLCDSLEYSEAGESELKQRNRSHLDRFFDDDLDPRAWRGVYGLVGEDTGMRIKDILKTSLTG